jgi:ubiquinone biosynthesis protein
MNARHRRQREIAQVLVRHGWGFLLDAVGLEHLRPAGGGPRAERRDESPSPPERLRLALEELGTTFVKLGQTLSTRADLLPPDYQAELAKLQDAGPQLPPEVVREAVALELDGDPESAFASFDLEPLAAASIGQAHAATLHDGTEVVVKLRRPGAVETAEQDLEILHNLAMRASRRWTEAAAYDLVGLADEFAQTLRAEMDYLQEGRNAERFAKSFADVEEVQIPRVFWATTTSRVITLERMRGMKITDLAALDAAGVDRHQLMQRAVRVTAKMVFEDGFFHADPHPGNFFIQADGRIGIIDFGMVGTLDQRLRQQLLRLLIALIREDPDRLAGALLALGAAARPVDRPRLRDDLAGLVARYGGRSLGDIALSSAIGEILEISRRHRLRTPRDLALLTKAFIMDEGLAETLDPDFQLADALAPYAYRQMATELSPAALAGHLKQVGTDLAELTIDLPDQLHRMLAVLADGGLEIHLRAAELEPLVERAERLGNRIAASVLAAAVIDGMAELAAADGAHIRNGARTLKRYAVLGGLGAVSAYGARKRRRVRQITRGHRVTITKRSDA